MADEILVWSIANAMLSHVCNVMHLAALDFELALRMRIAYAHCVCHRLLNMLERHLLLVSSSGTYQWT